MKKTSTHASLVALGHGDDVLVLGADRHRFLLLGDLLDGPELIAQRGGPLELQILGSLVHLAGEGAEHVVVLAFEEEHDLVDDLAVLLLRGVADAGGERSA